VRKRIKDLKHSQFIGGRIIYQCLKRCWLGVKFFSDGRFRSEILTTLRFGKQFHQQSTFTTSDRYPLLFKECADYLSSINNPTILSFGCSTGEEVNSIGQYLPNATIMGVDINIWCLKQGCKKYKNQNFSFVRRFSKEFEEASDFDAIFCMAVFQRTENRTNSDNSVADGFRFDQFEQEVNVLDGKLKSCGLLIIDQSDFSFTDTVCSEKYTPLISFERNRIVRNRPLFDRNNRKVAESQNNYRVFVKHGSLGK